jgi:hypothetical protein
VEEFKEMSYSQHPLKQASLRFDRAVKGSNWGEAKRYYQCIKDWTQV